jgi:hypothetical protein
MFVYLKSLIQRREEAQNDKEKMKKKCEDIQDILN